MTPATSQSQPVCKRCGQVHTKCKGHKRRKPGSTEPLQPCKGSPLRGKATCKDHNGRAAAGIASPTFKHGRRSLLARLPLAWAEGFNPDNPRLLEMREHVAMIDGHIGTLVDELKAGEQTAPAWRDAQKAWAQFKRARDARNAKAMVAAAEKVDDILTVGADRASKTVEVFDQADRRARLVAVESKRQKDAQEMVHRSDFAMFAKAVLLTIATNVPDLKARAAIQEDVLRFMAASQVPMLQAVNE